MFRQGIKTMEAQSLSSECSNSLLRQGATELRDCSAGFSRLRNEKKLCSEEIYKISPKFLVEAILDLSLRKGEGYGEIR
jgi:hypothetical protein